MTNITRKLTYVSPSDLKPNPANPRKHSRTQIRVLAKSMQAFGFNAPILVDRHMLVVAGHGRLEAAKFLNLARIPVIHLDDLDECQVKGYVLADNKLAERSSWDDLLLAAYLKELSELTVEFDLEATGFEMPEIDLKIQSLEAEPADTADDYEVTKGPPVTKLGDVWRLGDHIICCGSALDISSYANLPQEEVTAVFTDAPYNVRVKGHVSGLGKIKHQEFAQASGEMTAGEFTGFLAAGLKLAKDRCRPGALLYCCMDWRHMQEIQGAAASVGLELVNLCVWAKTNGGMGAFYRSAHELVFVFRNGSSQHCNNVQLGRFGRNRTNVWHYPGANTFGGAMRSPLEHHPTPKPVALVADAIMDCTARGDRILDPFLGSGTTVLAAERKGRKAFGIEIEPRFVDTVIQRWQKMTGFEACLYAGGRGFGAVRAERTGS